MLPVNFPRKQPCLCSWINLKFSSIFYCKALKPGQPGSHCPLAPGFYSVHDPLWEALPPSKEAQTWVYFCYHLSLIHHHYILGSEKLLPRVKVASGQSIFSENFVLGCFFPGISHNHNITTLSCLTTKTLKDGRNKIYSRRNLGSCNYLFAPNG